MGFFQGEMIGDDKKKSVILTLKGLTAILWTYGYDHKERWGDGADFLKYIKGLKWKEEDMG